MDFGLENDLGGSSPGGGGGVKATKKVKNLRSGLQFVDVDVFAIKDHIGPKAAPYSAFFVDTSRGDYSEVWGIKSMVPHNEATAYRIV